ncbi:MAG: hypothetical protein IJ074_05135 [Clostridia bacterium]|nr:hypothetical protein [Clostridia bacterium]MBQ8972446.1 hypothetical protein [Clostridia bacterium]
MEFEVVREIQNECANNQMRDVFFDEIETDDPVEYVKNLLKNEQRLELTVEDADSDNITVFADCSGMVQKFVFTRI